MNWERVKLVATTILAVWGLVAIVTSVWNNLNKSAQAAALASRDELRASDAGLSQRISVVEDEYEKLYDVVNLNSTVLIEPRNSVDYAAAVSRIRAMRRISN